jgi:uncharacterized membrane protein (GlpM family)
MVWMIVGCLSALKTCILREIDLLVDTFAVISYYEVPTVLDKGFAE